MSHSVNFLHSAEDPKRHRAHARRRVIRILLWTLCAFCALWAVLVLFASGVVVSAALDGKDSLQKARVSAMALDFDAAASELLVADARFGAAERGFFVLRTVRFVPWVSAQVDAADAMLVSGRGVVEALASVVSLGGELVRLTGFSEGEIRAMADEHATRARFLEEICTTLHAAPVQHIGKILVIFRPRPEQAATPAKKKIKLRPKPARRTKRSFQH